MVDDVIIVEIEFHLIDGEEMIDGGQFKYSGHVVFGEDITMQSNIKQFSKLITLVRSGLEKPVLLLDAEFLTETTENVMVSGYYK